MNLPAGEPVETGIDVKDVDLRKTLLNFFNASLNGYLCVMIEGYDGVEEGVLVFKAGHPVAASYEYLKHDKSVAGEGALSRVFNAVTAPSGIVDVYSMSKEQTDLVISFNADAVFKKILGKSDIEALATQQYTEKYAIESVGVKEKPFSKREVLKRYRLEEIVSHKGPQKGAVRQ